MTKKPKRPWRRDRQVGPWLALLAPLAALGLLLAATALTREAPVETVGEEAPDFELPGTDGSTVRLTDVTADRDALLFFSMGVGCDGCFLQIPEIEDRLAEHGIRLLSVMVDPPEHLAMESARLGVRSPILVDADRSVSASYGMLGQYGHGDVPSHSFAFVRAGGELAWVRHYAEMFVPADQLFDDLPL
jgi:peroxiredoxin